MPLERHRYFLAPGFVCWRLFEPDTRAILKSSRAPDSWALSPEVVSLLTVVAFAGLADLQSPEAGRLSQDAVKRLEAEIRLLATLTSEDNDAVIDVLGKVRRRMERKHANPAGAFRVAFFLSQCPGLLSKKPEAIALEVAKIAGVKIVSTDVVKKAVAFLLKVGAVIPFNAKLSGDFGPPGIKLEPGQSYQFDKVTGLPIVKPS